MIFNDNCTDDDSEFIINIINKAVVITITHLFNCDVRR